jgi:collagenase-like PrtC family protease
MRLSVATNWDPDLIDALSQFPIYELFGALASTPVGGGRPSFLLARSKEDQAEEYIHAVHRAGWTFNYLLNAPCMGNMEYDRDVHRDLIQHLGWLQEIGVDTVTVTIPYLLQIIKRQFPKLRVKISVIAHVNSIARMQFYEEMKADEIALDYMSNRDFKFLKRAKEVSSCDLTLLVNDMCLYQCPYRTYHYNICGHASQSWHPNEGFYVDYCIVSCSMQKLTEPEQLIRSRWIRPEDISRYENLGYQNFKISGRRMSTAWLTRAVSSYAQQRYDGNLGDLLDGVTPGVDPDMRSPQYEMMLSGAKFLKAEKLVALGQFFPVRPIINNRALDGFLEHFEKQQCAVECADCSYCQTIASKVVQIDEQESKRYCQMLGALKEDLVSSRMFLGDSESQTSDTLSQMEDSMNWDVDTKKKFDHIVGSVPESLRAMAEQVIAKMSEEIAKGRGATCIEQSDMVKAFMQYTPDAFKADMIKGLEELGINPKDY